MVWDPALDLGGVSDFALNMKHKLPLDQVVSELVRMGGSIVDTFRPHPKDGMPNQFSVGLDKYTTSVFEVSHNFRTKKFPQECANLPTQAAFSSGKGPT